MGHQGDWVTLLIALIMFGVLYALMAFLILWSEYVNRHKNIKALKKERNALEGAVKNYKPPQKTHTVFNDDDPGEEMFVLKQYHEAEEKERTHRDNERKNSNFLCDMCKHRHSIACRPYIRPGYICPGDNIKGDFVYEPNLSSNAEEATK